MQSEKYRQFNYAGNKPITLTKVQTKSGAQKQVTPPKRASAVPKKPYVDKKTEAGRRVLRCLRNWVLRQKYTRIKKQHRYRQCVLQELYSTEINYIKDLLIIMNLSVWFQQWLPKQSVDAIFSNIKQIYKLNEQFLNSLQKEFIGDKKIVYKPYSKVGLILVEYALFFKMYVIYFQDFNKSQATLHKSLQECKEFREYCQGMVKMSEYNHLDIESFLVKPIQRLPKYLLLLNDLIKHTEKTHPDYINLLKAQEYFSRVNEDNNVSLNQIMDRRMFDLQKQFPQIEIVDSKRTYTGADTMTLFWKGGQRNVIAHLLSDLVLFTERLEDGQFGLICDIYIDEQSQALDHEDWENFKNLVQFKGLNNSVIIIESSTENKQMRLRTLNELIEKIKIVHQSRLEALKKNNIQSEIKHNITVNIIGVEERKTMLNSHKVYIAEITIGEVVQKIYVRFSECQKIQDEVRRIYPKCNLNVVKQTMNFLNCGDKEIEGRILQLTNFLTGLLQQPFMRQEIRFLKQLGLPEEFYDLPNRITDDVRQQVRRSTRGTTDVRSNFRGSSASNLDTPGTATNRKFSATQILRSELNFKDKQPEKKQNLQQMQVSIHIFNIPQKPLIQIITNQTRTIELIEAISKELQIHDVVDFRLMILDSKGRLKPLDDDEIVFTLFNSIVASFTKKELFFRKYLYFDIQTEKMHFNEEERKLNLVFNQLVNEVVSANYNLSFNDFCEIAALYLQSVKKSINYENLQDIIPNIMLKYQKKEIWLLTVTNEWKKSRQELKNSESLLHDSEIEDKDMGSTVSWMIKFYEKISSNQLFGKQLFQVVCKSHAKVFGDSNIILAIGYMKTLLFDSKKKAILMEVQNIKDIKVFPGSVQIYYEENVLDGIQTLKLETTQGFQIQSLYNEYQE